MRLTFPWTVAYQAPPSMEFSRQEYWSGLPFTSPGELLDLGIEPRSSTWQADTLPTEPPGKPKFVEGLVNLYNNMARRYFYYLHLNDEETEA